MTIKQIVEEYVAYKQSLGLRFHSPAVKLNAFLIFGSLRD
jgi:hypothetical protein